MFELFDVLVHTPPTPNNKQRLDRARAELRKLLGEDIYADFCKAFQF